MIERDGGERKYWKNKNVFMKQVTFKMTKCPPNFLFFKVPSYVFVFVSVNVCLCAWMCVCVCVLVENISKHLVDLVWARQYA